MAIPFVDLPLQYRNLKTEIDAAISRVLDRSAFIGGDDVRAFESEFAAFVGTSHAVGCANGTDSIEILLEALGVGRGHEVLVPAMTWISTSEAVSRLGAKPVFVDVDHYATIDADELARHLTDRTRAIIPVHLYGQPAPMDRIMAFAAEHGLKVLEDCAQAHGARWQGRRVGTFGDAASFSFYPGKNLGAYGDAGCMVTDSDETAVLARRIANHGQLEKHSHAVEGRNSRLDGLQAAVLRVKLPHLESWTAARRAHADAYSQRLSALPLQLPSVRPECEHVYNLYVVRTSDRNDLRDHLQSRGIASGVHYPRSLPLLECYQDLGFRPEDHPRAHELATECLSLPMYPELSEAQIQEVVEAIRDYVA